MNDTYCKSGDDDLNCLCRIDLFILPEFSMVIVVYICTSVGGD